jgi:hypothetical protein
MKSQDLLDKINAQARPTWGPALDDYIAQATAHGWTLDALAHELNKGIGPGTSPGYIVVTLKRLATSPPLTRNTNPRHPIITYPANPVPMPEWFKEALNKGGSSEDFEEALNKRHPRLDTKKLAKLQARKDALPLEDYLTHALDVHPQTTTPPTREYPTTGVA